MVRDWVGSEYSARTTLVQMVAAQGLSTVDIKGVVRCRSKEVVQALRPRTWSARSFAEHWGPIPGVRSSRPPASRARPADAHLDQRRRRSTSDHASGRQKHGFPGHFGDGSQPAHAGIGFIPGVDRAWFADAVRRHDSPNIRAALHRTEVSPGDVFVASTLARPIISARWAPFIEVQEPSDRLVIAEAPEQEELGATMGLGWDVALDMIDYSGQEERQPWLRPASATGTAYGSRIPGSSPVYRRCPRVL